MNRWRFALLTAVATLVLGGCLRFSADLTVTPDNTVSGLYVVAVEQGTGTQYGMSDAELSEELWGDYGKASSLTNVTYADYHEDGYVGISIAFADAPLATFAPSDTDWGIARVGEEFVVSGPSNGVTQAVENDTAEDELSSALADAQFEVSVTFPGEVTEHNGALTGRTVTWQLQNAPAQLSARGDAVAVPDRAAPLAWLAASVLLVGGFAYWLAGRISRRTP